MIISRLLIFFAAASGLAAAADIASPSLARAQETGAAMNTGIIVQGTGEVQVTPDIARVTLGVVTQGADAAKTGQANAARTDAIIKAIRAAGVAEKDIQTSGYSLTPRYSSSSVGGVFVGGSQNQPPKEPVIIGYEAQNSVQVTVRKISDTGKVIDAAIKAGANLAGGITFDLNDAAAEKARDEALRRAVADGKRKALVIAGAADLKQLGLRSITEGGVNFPRPMMDYPMMKMQMSAAGAPTPVAPGEQTVSATVTVHFSFAPVLVGG